MISILQYGGFDSFGFAALNCPCRQSEVTQWLLYGKLPENVIISKAAITTTPYLIEPSAKNRFLASVTINK